MPIVEPAPWRHQYFSSVDCPPDVFIPTDDPEAWSWNPRHRWVFDKLQVALSQGLDAAPHGLAPSTYPAFSKPIYNFGGLGAGSAILHEPSDYEAAYRPGHMWMPLLTGPHVSTDAAVVEGTVRWIRHATGHPTFGGMFDYWTIHATEMPQLSRTVEDWIGRHLHDYTGMLNLETIGGTIIDAHLRFADQWPDLYGMGWLEALVALYSSKAWSFQDTDRRDGYSLALFLPHGQPYRHPPAEIVAQALAQTGVSSVQITFHESKPPEAHSNPPGGFRVAVVNATDLDAGRRSRELLHGWFETRGTTSKSASIG